MGLILDSSVVIAAERRGDNVTQMLKQIVAATGDQRTVLSSVGLTELVHGIYRAQTAQARSRRDSFIRELLNDVEVYPYTKETALLAGKIDGEQQSRGIIIPFGDLLIGATAQSSAVWWLLRLAASREAFPG
jgi:predicted nucleic acid-binding protein